MANKNSQLFNSLANASKSGDRKEPEKKKKPNYAQARESSILSIMSHDRHEKLLFEVEPELCTPWKWHNRDYSRLTAENCADLINAIHSQNGQEIPAIVRKTGDGETPYEIISGARRHFAITQLRKMGYSYKYLVEVRDLTDEAAFRFADIENRARKDISDLERARDYLEALSQHYDNNQAAMAKRLEVSEVWLSRHLTLARLNPVIIGAYAQPDEIRVRHATELSPLMKNQRQERAILAEAEQLSSQQSRLKENGKAPIAGPAVLSRLKKAAKNLQGAKAKSKTPSTFSHGKIQLDYKKTPGNRVMISLNAIDATSNKKEVKEALMKLIDQL